jgi:hypothetical protein
VTTAAHAEPVALGTFTFDSRLFGATMTPEVPGSAVTGAWLNVVPVAPAPGTYRTGPNFNTGILLAIGPTFTIGYSAPIMQVVRLERLAARRRSETARPASGGR